MGVDAEGRVAHRVLRQSGRVRIGRRRYDGGRLARRDLSREARTGECDDRMMWRFFRDDIRHERERGLLDPFRRDREHRVSS